MYLYVVEDCVKPFASALQRLSSHSNKDGKKVIREMIAEMTKRSPCVAKGDVHCILKHLAQSVGVIDMIELQREVQPKLRSTMAKIKSENQKAINKLKTMKSGKAAGAVVCDVRNTKAHMINEALQKVGRT